MRGGVCTDFEPRENAVIESAYGRYVSVSPVHCDPPPRTPVPPTISAGGRQAASCHACTPNVSPALGACLRRASTSVWGPFCPACTRQTHPRHTHLLVCGLLATQDASSDRVALGNGAVVYFLPQGAHAAMEPGSVMVGVMMPAAGCLGGRTTLWQTPTSAT